MKRSILFLAALCLALPRLCLPVTAQTDNSAACCILTDADSGAVLYEKNADQRCLIASTTKIMTAYLVCLDGGLERTVTVPPEAAGIEGSSMYLRAGETLTRLDLLYGLMLSSGNDAAAALAVSCAGSQTRFVARMNETAAALGLRDTRFANPHGLDSGENYASARDLARLTAAALKNETFRQVVGTKTVTAAGRSLTNHNKLLWRCEGCVGVKTGYTRAAGRILVSAARREGRTLICVTIRDPDDWDDHLRLLEDGFSRYRSTLLAQAGSPLCRVPLPPDGVGTAAVTAQTTLRLGLLPRERVAYRYAPENALLSPLVRGADAGTVEILVDGRLAAEIPVTWSGEAETNGGDYG